MGSCETGSLTSKICDSRKTKPALVYCRADSAFLVACDSKIHSTNKLAFRHSRVWVCEVCEQAPAVVTCKSDAAALCAVCDGDIHSENPLTCRHQRLPVVPFNGAASTTKSATFSASASFGNDYDEEEAEAASWLLMKLDEGPGWLAYKSHHEEYLFCDSDPFLDLDLISVEQKPMHVAVDEQQEHSRDGVPVQAKNEFESGHILGPVVNGFPTHDVKSPMYRFTSQSMSQSVSSSSLEMVVVPDHNSATAYTANDCLCSHPDLGDRQRSKGLKVQGEKKEQKV